MKVIGFNFTSIHAERSNSIIDQVKISNKMDISSITALKSDLLNSEEEFLEVTFTYTVLYEPAFSKIELTGTIVISLESKMAKEVLIEWKDRNTPEEFRILILNVILRKSNLKALDLEDELNLPPHLPLPSIKKSDIQEDKKN